MEPTQKLAPLGIVLTRLRGGDVCGKHYLGGANKKLRHTQRKSEKVKQHPVSVVWSWEKPKERFCDVGVLAKRLRNCPSVFGSSCIWKSRTCYIP